MRLQDVLEGYDIFAGTHGTYLGKIPNLTNIFQSGWNHQLDVLANSCTTKSCDCFQDPWVQDLPKSLMPICP